MAKSFNDNTVGARKIDTLRNKFKQKTVFFIASLYFFSNYAYNIERAYMYIKKKYFF